MADDTLAPGGERDLFIAVRGARTITFHMRLDFGNGKDEAGIPIGPIAERDATIRWFTKLMDKMAAGMPQPVERVVGLRSGESE